MPEIENTLPDNILNLIREPDLEYNIWKPEEGHYIHCVVLRNESVVAKYQSNQLWDGTVVYQNSEGVPFYDAALTEQVCGGTQYGIEETSCDQNTQDWTDVLEVPYYKDSVGNIFVKPNDILEKSQDDYDNGKYKFVFNFIQNVWDTDGFTTSWSEPRFSIKEISTTRKEIRLLGKHYLENDTEEVADDPNAPLDFDENFIEQFENSVLDVNGDFDANLFVLPNTGHKLYRALNFAFDSVSFDLNSLILKFNNALPGSIQRHKQVQLVKEIWSTQTQEVTFFSAYHEPDPISTLEIGSIPNTDTQFDDDAQSWNDIVENTAISSTQKTKLLENIFSSSIDSFNLDYSDVTNHAFFGSAEYKLRNFYSKIQKIENYYNEISTSLGEVTSSALTSAFSRRTDLFGKINEVVLGFTPYEKWMYYDYESTSSYPNAGRDYTKMPAITGSFDSNFSTIVGNGEVLTDYQGIDLVYKVSSTGDNVVVSSSFDTGSFGEDIHNYWYTGSNTTNWAINKGKLTVHNAGVAGHTIYQITSSENTTAGEQYGLSPFELGKNYVIEFDVTEKTTNGTINFALGYGDSGPYTSHTFTITSTGHHKQEIANTSTYQDGFIGDSVLAITPGSNFSGSIDNLTVRNSMDYVDGRADIFTNRYHVEDYPMSSHNGKFYLSFLAKWQIRPEWENYNLSSSFYLPEKAFQNEYIENPSASMEFTGSWHRYIYAASQSYWRPVEGGDQIQNDTEASDTAGTYFEILSGSAITGSYEIDPSFMDSNSEGLLSYGNKVVLPSGELFRIYQTTSSAENAPVSSSYLTDVKIFTEDTLYSASYSNAVGSITDVLPFSHLYSTSSQIVQDWYSSSLGVAQDYDRNNIHSLWINLPKFVREEDDDKLLHKFISMLGDQYDVMKNYIDNYLNIHSRDYDSSKSMPDLLLKDIGDNFGWKFINSNSFKNLLEYYIGEETAGLSYKDVTSTIWRHILNNLIYIYKSKGTENSVRALLSTFGIPPDLLTVSNVVSSDSQVVQRSPGLVNLASASLENVVSDNLNYIKKQDTMHLLNFGPQSHNLKMPWGGSGSNSAHTTGYVDSISFFFSTYSTGSSTLVIASGSHGAANKLWELAIVPSASSTSSILEWRFNNKLTGSLGSSTFTTMSTDLLHDEDKDMGLYSSDNRKIWHMELSRTSSPLATTGSYQMRLGRKETDGDKIIHGKWMNFTLTGSANVNFMPGGTSPYGNYYLFLGNRDNGTNFKGSIGYPTIRSGSLTDNSFYNNIFNFNNTSNEGLYSFNQNIVRYNFKYLSPPTSTSPVNDVFPNNKGDFSWNTFNDASNNNQINPTIRKQAVTIYKFSPRSLNLNNNRSTKTINIASTPSLKSNGLTHDNYNLKFEPHTDEYGKIQQKTTSIVKFGFSPTSLIDDLISDNFSDINMGEVLADPSNYTESTYSGLDKLKETFFKNYSTDLIDINDFNRRISKLFPKPLWDALREILPANIKLEEGVSLESVGLHRNKISFGTGGGATGAEAGHIEFSTSVFTDVDMTDSNIQDPPTNTNSDELLNVTITDTSISVAPESSTQLESEVGMSSSQVDIFDSSINHLDQITNSLESTEINIVPESTLQIEDNVDINTNSDFNTITEGTIENEIIDESPSTNESVPQNENTISFEEEQMGTSIFETGNQVDATITPEDEINVEQTSTMEQTIESETHLSDTIDIDTGTSMADEIVGEMTGGSPWNFEDITGEVLIASDSTVPTIDQINLVSQVDDMPSSDPIEVPTNDFVGTTDSNIEGTLDSQAEINMSGTDQTAQISSTNTISTTSTDITSEVEILANDISPTLYTTGKKAYGRLSITTFGGPTKASLTGDTIRLTATNGDFRTWIFTDDGSTTGTKDGQGRYKVDLDAYSDGDYEDFISDLASEIGNWEHMNTTRVSSTTWDIEQNTLGNSGNSTHITSGSFHSTFTWQGWNDSTQAWSYSSCGQLIAANAGFCNGLDIVPLTSTDGVNTNQMTTNYQNTTGEVHAETNSTLDVEGQLAMTENTQVSTVDTATAFSISDDNYHTSGELQETLFGNTTDSNTNFDNVIGTNFDQEIRDKYIYGGTANNDNYAKVNPYTMATQSYYETDGATGTFIGDTEIISSRQPTKVNVKVRTANGWQTGHKMFVYDEFDTTNKDHFKNSEQGRTSRIDINWTTGEITYPDNWIGHHIDKRLLEEQAKGTIELGENLTHNDPTGQLKSENRDGAIWSVDVGGTNTSNRLKVEK